MKAIKASLFIFACFSLFATMVLAKSSACKHEYNPMTLQSSERVASTPKQNSPSKKTTTHQAAKNAERRHGN